MNWIIRRKKNFFHFIQNKIQIQLINFYLELFQVYLCHLQAAMSHAFKGVQTSYLY